MAEQHLENVGQNDMIVATSMLTPPKSVVNLRFIPRTLPLQTFIVMGVTATIGFLLATAVAGSSMESLTYGVVLGGGLGFLGTRMSPLEGEGMLTWMGLQAKSAVGKKVTIDGVRCARHVGFAPLHWVSLGPVRMRPGCVSVRATGWDERGYPEWGADDKGGAQRESSTDLLRRHMEGRPTNTLRPGAGMSLSDILSQQEQEREEQSKRIRKQLPSYNGAPGRKRAKKTPAPANTAPALRPTGGRPLRQEPLETAPEPEKKRRTLGKKDAPKPPRREKSKKEARKPGKKGTPKPPRREKSKKKRPSQEKSAPQLKPTAGRSKRSG